MKNIDNLSISTIRTLAIDSIEKAQSGHPGMPMGAAPMAYTLFANHMNHNPKNPQWFNRDRFVLSAGHGSMLLYSLLHLHGYDISMDDLKQFRQWGSKTPGHPEFGHTPGVDATTGPLGQGLAMAVGMAMAERYLAATYNRAQYNIVDHYTYAICGDGDLMEGVASESASLAGHLKLGRMIVLYDSNDISLDGDLDKSFSENVEERYKAYGWQVIRVEDGNDLEEINKALHAAKKDDRPTMIEVKTTIGYGSPNKSGKSASHGSPLGKEEAKLTKENYKWTFGQDFHVPNEVREHYEKQADLNAEKEKQWNQQFQAYKSAHPELAKELELAIKGDLPQGWDKDIPVYKKGDNLATREAGGEIINGISKNVRYIFGGSADLASSNKTMLNGVEDFTKDNYRGRNIWFGVREFAMACAVNGMALHRGVKPYGATFFIFSDYLRPAMRLSALMQVPVTYIFTHDSIAVGEDGPTHEPVEQLAAMRALPGLCVIRPADGNETVAAYRLAFESKNVPTALILTRQGVPTLESTDEKAYQGVSKGAYIVSPAKGEAEKPENPGKLDGVLIATGSEVSLAIEAQQVLERDGLYVSVVSMPSWDLFEKQSEEYKTSVIPKAVKSRLAIEMGVGLGWERYVGDHGGILSIEQFGASAPGTRIMQEYGFTVENVVARFKKLLK